MLASISLVLVALSFTAGGLGLLLGQVWWRPMMMGAAVLPAAVFFLFWDGKYQASANQGGVGLLIDLAILVVVLVLKGP